MLVKGSLSFLAGLVGFLSPCVLPLLPGYVAFMTGSATEEDVPLRRALTGTLAFVAGLTAVFVSLGASASVLSGFLNDHKRSLEIASGIFVVGLGLVMVFAERIPFLVRERRFHLRVRPGASPARTFLLGAAFAFGWTPCIGPTLGAALNLAATSEGLASGIWLLFAYSLGIGVPFVLAGLGFLTFGGRLKRHSATIQRIGGFVLVVVGLLVATGRLTAITVWMQRGLTGLNLDLWNI